MTTPKPRRNETTLTKGAAVDKIASIAASAEDRYNAALAEIRSADIAKMRALLNRVPAADQAAVAKMLAALNIVVPVMDVDGDFNETFGSLPELLADDETPSRPSTAEYDADELPRGAQEYPAERAAIARKR